MASFRRRIERLEARLGISGGGLSPEIRAFLDELYQEAGISARGLNLRERLEAVAGTPDLRRACVRKFGSTPVAMAGRLIFTGVPRTPDSPLQEDDKND